MIEVNGQEYKVWFIDHTPERIRQFRGKPITVKQGDKLIPDTYSRRILGNHPGTIAIVYKEWGGFEVLAVGASRLYSGGIRKEIVKLDEHEMTVRVMHIPPDVYKKKEGHNRSLNDALRKLNLTREERLSFINQWHNLNPDGTEKHPKKGSSVRDDLPF